MAFVPQFSPDQDPNQQPGQNPLSQQAPITSAPNAGGAGATAKAANSSPAQPFTNLQSYLTANAPQIGQMGQDIAGKVTNQYGQISNDINQTSANFNSSVNAGYTPNNADVVSAFSADPTKVAANPDQSKTFKGMYNDSYNGPMNFETTPDYTRLSGEVQQGQDLAKQVSTIPGLQSYLSAGKPDYSTGQSTLDSVLLQGNPEAVNSISSAAAPYANLPGYLTSAVSTGDAAAQNAVHSAQAAKAAAQGAYSTAETGLNTKLSDQLKKATGQADTYNTDVNSLRGVAGDYSSAIQAYLAAHPQVSTTSNALDPWANLQPVNSPDMASTATKGDFDTLAALSQLGPGSVTAPITSDMASKAGSFNLPKDLQAALANKDVYSAMNSDLGGISKGIMGAYQPFADLNTAEGVRAQLQTQLDGLYKQRTLLVNQRPDMTTYDDKGNQIPNPAFATWNDQVQALGSQINGITSDQHMQQDYRSQIGQKAQQLQWVPGAANDYNALIQKLQGEVGPLGSMNVPSVNTGDNGISTDALVGLAENLNLPADVLKALNIPTDALDKIGHGISSGLQSVGDFFSNLF